MGFCSATLNALCPLCPPVVLVCCCACYVMLCLCVLPCLGSSQKPRHVCLIHLSECREKSYRCLVMFIVKLLWDGNSPIKMNTSLHFVFSSSSTTTNNFTTQAALQLLSRLQLTFPTLHHTTHTYPSCWARQSDKQ